MNTLKLEARGKINLTLDIVGKRDDGYHNVSMIMQSIALADKLEFKTTGKGIRLSCDKPYIPLNKRNIVHKTITLIKEKYNIKSGVEVHIEKNIPVSAGLAGGSTDAAATLVALNKLWGLDLEQNTLLELAYEIGADVPFCILGGTALAEGIGEKLTPIKALPHYYLVLVKPKISVSTSWAYSVIKFDQITLRPDNEQVLKEIQKGHKDKIPSLLCNVFEQFIFKKYPQLASIKDNMKNLGALGTLMSGSGPTIYGLFEDREVAKEAYRELSKDSCEVLLSETFSVGGN